MTSALEAISYLKGTSSTDGTSLFNQLTSVLLKVLEEKPANALDLLESTLLQKVAALSVKDLTPLVPATSAADAAGAVAAAALYGMADGGVDENGDPVEPEPVNEYECEDVIADGVLLDAVGAGVGLAESHSIMLAVRKLGEDSKRGVNTVRFFGKFFGVSGDYYVFETTVKEPQEEAFPEVEGKAPVELAVGVNAFVYFVCNRLGGPMTLLPSVTPDQIKAARQLKRYLTGRLTATLSTFPAFPGTEAHFLRAQIARISCATVCCPAKFFELTEDGEMVKPEEPEPTLPGRDMAYSTNWAHRYPHLKKQGRCEVWKREAPEEEEETFPWTEEELEEGPPLLRTVDKDEGINGGNPAWTSLYSSSSENVKSQVGGVRSNMWPGAYCVSQGEHFANVYIGWGLKNVPFTPAPPPPLGQTFDPMPKESNDLPPKPAPPAAEEEEEE